MKAPFIHLYIFLFSLAALTSLAVSCAKRPMPTEVTKVIVRDSIVYREKESTATNQAIIDSLRFAIAEIKTAKPECDSICQDAIDRVLKSVNVTKQSGDNGYKLKYNELIKALELYIKVESTKSSTKEVSELKKHSDSSDSVRYVPQPYIPDFWRYSAYFGWACAAYFAISLILKIKSVWPLPVK